MIRKIIYINLLALLSACQPHRVEKLVKLSVVNGVADSVWQNFRQTSPISDSMKQRLVKKYNFYKIRIANNASQAIEFSSLDSVLHVGGSTRYVDSSFTVSTGTLGRKWKERVGEYQERVLDSKKHIDLYALMPKRADSITFWFAYDYKFENSQKHKAGRYFVTFIKEPNFALKYEAR
jgi:hypothetical protein